MGTEIKKIELDDLHMSYRVRNGWHHVLKGISIDIPQNRSIGILGRNGAGKSTLISILSGLIRPNKGSIKYNGIKVSWPVGRPAFQGSLTGANNIKFFCRLFNLPIRETIDFVEDFAELGKYMHMPIKSYSSGMRTRLGFGLSMAIDFDTMLIDEGFNAGDARFTQKMNDLFDQKRETHNMICVSHNGGVIKKFCDYAAILRDGKLEVYEDIEEALSIYKNL
jgi:capsular polysaccharide transport system ATP-binding protein